MSQLTCYSFHSVKGGVGKSTLATWTAQSRALAAPAEPSYLIDMDLTGTSLADVLPLRAPCWPGAEGAAPQRSDSRGAGAARAIDLRQPPVGHLSLADTRERMEARGQPMGGRRSACGVPFLNDYLLFADPDWDERRDADPRGLLWRLEQGPSNLSVLPSSALPEDLEQILPVIFDENHSAFLEARLEHLLAALAPEQGAATVVIDTPPSLPGLSRAVLSLALRLGGERKLALAQDGIIPPRLQQATISWQVFLVTSEDAQDLRAADRWCELILPAERRRVQVLINRPRANDSDRERRDYLSDRLARSVHDMIIHRARFVEDSPALRFFVAQAIGPGLPPPSFLRDAAP